MLRKHSPQSIYAISTLSVSFEVYVTDSGMNFFIADWITTQGPLEVFSIIGGTHVFVMALTIPMYIYGKRARSLTARKKFYKAVMAK
jgi:hypothetical protein